MYVGGLALSSNLVVSIRRGAYDLKGSYVSCTFARAFLNVKISGEMIRIQILLTKKELKRLYGKLTRTDVTTKIYRIFRGSNNWFKVEFDTIRKTSFSKSKRRKMLEEEKASRIL